jgi:hypothetical protein
VKKRHEISVRTGIYLAKSIGVHKWRKTKCKGMILEWKEILIDKVRGKLMIFSKMLYFVCT